MNSKSASRRPDRLSDLSEESYRCRTNGHRWTPSRAEKVVGAFQTIEVCDVCSAERHSVISNRGAVRSRSIRYPDHYLNTGQGPLEAADRNAMRLAVLRWDFTV